jgi:hypothetical protein
MPRETFDDPEEELDAEGIPVLQDTVTSDGTEELPPPSDSPASLDFGTTVAEELQGETLRDRVKREEPEWRRGGDPTQVGQLIEPGAEEGFEDDEAEAIGQEVDDPDVALSPEESAMHVVDEP